MNAGRDVERLIAGWLDEEATPRAPDRILDAARSAIDRTGQRRLVVAWREPMYMSPIRLTAIAAAFAVAMVGAAWFGRMTASPGVGGPVPTPSTTESSAPAGVTLEAFTAAHDAICGSYAAQIDPYKAKLKRIYDPTLPAADRAVEIDALRNIVTLTEAMTAELEALDAPASLAAAKAVYVSNYRQIATLIRLEFPLIDGGDYVNAQALDDATNPLSRQIEAFENANHLSNCP